MGFFLGRPLPRLTGSPLPTGWGSGGKLINWLSASSTSSIFVTVGSVAGVGNGECKNGGDDPVEDPGEEHDIVRRAKDDAPEEDVEADDIDRRAMFRPSPALLPGEISGMREKPPITSSEHDPEPLMSLMGLQ